MSQTDHDIFTDEEKEEAKRQKIADMEAATAQAIMRNILDRLGAKYEQYHFRKYCVLIIPIGDGGIEVRISDSNIIRQRQAMQDKLAQLFDFISGEASLEEVVTYCRCNSFTYLGYKARKYAVIDKTTQKHSETSFESAFVPAGVTSIGKEAFYCCKSLVSIQLPEGVTSIGEGAFWGCELLKSIQLPAKVKAIRVGAFVGCSELVSIIVDSNNPVYDSRENCNAIIETSTDTLIVGCQNTVIPAGVTSIGNFAFNCCTLLESIQLPEGVTSIGNLAFNFCKSLESIQLSEGVTSIGNSAFKDCSSLKSITYSGTREQWGMIKKGRDWHSYIPAKVVHCTDGETEI